jgi:hypothetical protein
MPIGDYEWYSNQQANLPSLDDLPDSWGEDEYVEYCEDTVAEGDRPLDFVDWRYENADRLLASYKEYQAELKAEANID